jgi:hypothetical protein
VSGSIERKSRTAGLSSSTVSSTVVDSAENRTTVPTTSMAASASVAVSVVSGEVLGGVDAMTGVVVDVEGVSWKEGGAAGDDVLTTDPLPHAASVSIVIAAIGMA